MQFSQIRCVSIILYALKVLRATRNVTKGPDHQSKRKVPPRPRYCSVPDAESQPSLNAFPRPNRCAPAKSFSVTDTAMPSQMQKNHAKNHAKQSSTCLSSVLLHPKSKNQKARKPWIRAQNTSRKSRSLNLITNSHAHHAPSFKSSRNRKKCPKCCAYLVGLGGGLVVPVVS